MRCNAVDGRPTSRVFAASRKFGWGGVIVYAQDALTLDDEITEDSDNLLFAQNALAWLTPLELRVRLPGEGHDPGVGRHVRQDVDACSRCAQFIERRGWALKETGPDALEDDLKCAGVLWYLSDWEPPPEFADVDVPLIEEFVQRGGGLLVGGLGWSYARAGRAGRDAGDGALRRRRARQAFRLRVHARRVRVARRYADHPAARAIACREPRGRDDGC